MDLKLFFGDALNEDEIRGLQELGLHDDLVQDDILNDASNQNNNNQRRANGQPSSSQNIPDQQSDNEQISDVEEDDSNTFVSKESQSRVSLDQDQKLQNSQGIESDQDSFGGSHIDQYDNQQQNSNNDENINIKEEDIDQSAIQDKLQQIYQYQQKDVDMADSYQEDQKLQTIKKVNRVQWSDQQKLEQNQKSSIDIPVLLKKRDEIIYRLTELYLPKSEDQKKKMREYNRDKMHHINHDDPDYMRTNKRKIKEAMKSQAMKIKLKHQIQYVDPTPELDEIQILYKPNLNTKQLDMLKEKKLRSQNFIAKIIPSKRNVNQALIDQQKGQTMLQLQELNKQAQQNQESQLKNYVVEDKCGIGSESLVNEWDAQIRKITEATDPKLEQEKLEEKKYMEICDKMIEQDLSLTDLTDDERFIIKKYLKASKDSLVEAKYPIIKLPQLQKDCFLFMKDLNAKDFSHKNQKSALQSEDQVDMYDDPLGLGLGGHNNNSQNVNIFGLPNERTSISDEKLSDLSFGEGGFHHHKQDKSLNNKSNEVTDAKIQDWYFEQKQNIMGQNNKKVKKYWGELKDCKSQCQMNLESYQFQKFQDTQYLNRGSKDEKIFKLEKVQEVQKSNQKGKNQNDAFINQDKFMNDSKKDIGDYEFLKSQEKYFYEDFDRKTNINTIMRRLQFSLGMIKEEEFYQQEALADQIEAQNHQYNRTQQIKDQGKDKKIEIQLRKEKISSDFIDNLDFHFDRRKKELHENLMKKIQHHEKQNQQTTQTQQTVAYASGGHALQKASGIVDNKLGENKEGKSKSMNNYSKQYNEGRDSWKNYNESQQDEDINMMDDLSTHQRHGTVSVLEENHLKRVTKYELNHAKCILKLTFTKFEWSEKDLLNFHRQGIEDVFDQLKNETENELEQQKQMRLQQYLQQAQRLQIQNENYRLPYFNIGMNIITNELIEKRFKKIGIINAHEYFKDRYKLSLRDGKFCLFEHIDQNPLFINNFGMASKLKRYVYSDHILPQSAFLRRAENGTTRHMGPYGAQVLKQKGDKIPLLGQLDTRLYKGITVMENNMYYSPVFYHKAPRNDFLCVMNKDKKGNTQILVREIQDLYLIGQEEPKIEVYNPQSRQYQHFIKRRTQAYVIRFLQENNNEISFSELNQYFPYINDQILKKIIKEINVEVDRNQYCSLVQDYSDEQFKQLITPENICQYESAQYGEQVLKKIGIRDITNADKISYATNKFCSEETNNKKQQIARQIEEEVLSTPWNLSQNFIHNKQTRGMMMLEGIGDPSNGHGGYSYLKLPLKISQDSLNKAKINRMYLNPAIQNPKAVTGTDADLRKLSKGEIKNKLIEFGFKEKDIQGFTRWEMVAVLREQSCRAVQSGEGGDVKKFARGVRFTSKKQREMYQKQVNDIFKKQMNYLIKDNPDFISDQSDNETRGEQRNAKRITEQQQMSSNYSKNIVELKKDIPIKKIQDIPNYAILIMAFQPISALQMTQNSNQINGLNIGGNSGGGNTGIDLATGNIDPLAAQEALKKKISEGGTLKCTILRKKVKKIKDDKSDNKNQSEEYERIIYCSDPRQIKGFNKRKNKHEVKTKRTKKTSLKEKMQLQKANIEDLKDKPATPYMGIGNRSESSTNFKIGSGASQKNLHEGGSTKIQIGNSGNMFNDNQSELMSDYQPSQSTPIQISKSSIVIPNLQQPYQQQHQYHNQSSAISIPIMGSMIMDQSNQQQQNVKKNSKQLSRYQSNVGFNQQIEPNVAPTVMKTQHYDDNKEMNFSTQHQQQYQNQEQKRISISMGGVKQEPMHTGSMISLPVFSQPNLEQVSQQSQFKSKSKKDKSSKHEAPKQQKVQKEEKKKEKSKFAPASGLVEEDFDYKPKAPLSRRRQVSAETMLNELIGNIVDLCIVQDKGKLFHQKVSRKDAPLYYDVIKKPMDLGQIKSKTKRWDYLSAEEFLQDMELMKSNAELYNGIDHPISAAARNLFELSKEKLLGIDSDIQNLQMLIKEKLGGKLI